MCFLYLNDKEIHVLYIQYIQYIFLQTYLLHSIYVFMYIRICVYMFVCSMYTYVLHYVVSSYRFSPLKGTGSGIGTKVLELLRDSYPDVYK